MKLAHGTLAALLGFGLSACGAEQAESLSPSVDIASVDFGDDSSEWANDGECDDPRFAGPGMTSTMLLDDDIGHDASDCRSAYEAGELQLAPGD